MQKVIKPKGVIYQKVLSRIITSLSMKIKLIEII